MPKKPKYQLLFADMESAVRKTLDWLGDLMDSIVEGGGAILKAFGRSVVCEFLKHAWHAIVRFVQNPAQPLGLLKDELQHCVSSIANQIGNPFSSPDRGFGIVALLLAGVKFLFELATGVPFPFDPSDFGV